FSPPSVPAASNGLSVVPLASSWPPQPWLRDTSISAHLMQVLASGKIAVLTYWASAGQIVLLQYSNHGESWENLTRATAHSNSATFLVRQAPTAKGPSY